MRPLSTHPANDREASRLAFPRIIRPGGPGRGGAGREGQVGAGGASEGVPAAPPASASASTGAARGRTGLATPPGPAVQQIKSRNIWILKKNIRVSREGLSSGTRPRCAAAPIELRA